MSTLINYDIYRNEIKFAEKYDEAACALDHLSKKNQLIIKDLYRIVDACLEEKITRKSFEQCLKGMILEGLVVETFSNDKKFRIGLSPIGKEVHQALINKKNKHLVTVHY